MTSQTDEYLGFDLSAYKALYIEEAGKCLVTLRQNLIQLRDDPMDEEKLYEAHRAAHMLKGMSATMHYEALTALAETMEDPLRRADRQKLPPPLEKIESFLVACDEFEVGLDRLTGDGV